MHLPPEVRLSRLALERFVRRPPPSKPLTLTTISFIGKPRYSSVQVGHFLPAPPGRRRLGLVNYVRDITRENAARNWYNLRAVASFYVQEGAAATGTAAERHRAGKRSAVDRWIWDEVRRQIASRAAASPPMLK